MKTYKDYPSRFLKMLGIVFLVSFLNADGLHAQQTFCGTSGGPDAIGPIKGKFPEAKKGNGPYYINVYVHIVRRSNGTGGQTLSNVNSAFNILNADFNPHDIFFVRNCEINYIDNDDYYTDYESYCNFWLDPTITHTDGIDMFLGPSEGLNNAGGIASGIPGKSLWVAGTWNVGIPPTPALLTPVISHEMGHCLGLWHTFHGTVQEGGATCNGAPIDDPNACCELVNGSNGTTCGDYVADTNADPHDWYTWGPDCAYYVPICNGGSAAQCASATCPPFSDMNNDPYDPPVRNTMSYNQRFACIDGFTVGQGERMCQIIDISPMLQATLVTPGNPVLSVNTTVSDPTPALGDAVTISIEVCNLSGNQQNNIVVTNPIPTGLQFGSSADFQDIGGVLTSQTISLSPGSCTTLTFIAKVILQDWCSVNDCAFAEYAPNCPPVSDCVEFTPDPPLSITTTVSDAHPSMGGVVTVTVKVCNLYGAALNDLYVYNPIPDGLVFVSSTDFYPNAGVLLSGPHTFSAYDPGNPDGSCITLSFQARINECDVVDCAEVVYSIMCPPVRSCVTIDPQECNPCEGLIVVDHDCRQSSDGHIFDHMTLYYMGHLIGKYQDTECCVTWEYIGGIPSFPCPRPNGLPDINFNPVNVTQGQPYKVTIICGDCTYVESGIVDCTGTGTGGNTGGKNGKSAGERETGTNTIEDGLVKIYPNPAKNEIAIRFNYDLPESETYTLQIYDAYGRQVLSHTLLGSTQWQVLDISTYSPGAYTWHLTGESGKKILEQGKIIVIP